MNPELLNLVEVRFATDGSLRQVMMPTEKQLIGSLIGKNVHGSIQDLMMELQHQVWETLIPALRKNLIPTKIKVFSGLQDLVRLLIERGDGPWGSTVDQIILQKTFTDRYCSELISGRFQIMESILKGRYLVVDHTKFSSDPKKDWQAILRKGPQKGDGLPDTLDFSSVEEARSHIDQLVTGKTKAVPPVQPPTPKQVEAPLTALQRASPTGRRSMASVCRQLIQEGKLTDDQIHATVVKEFPSFRRTSVDWYRKELQSKA